MAYKELIKNFERIRRFMREFYVYGFKSREEYDHMSARSYDDERRRLESWLGGHMHHYQTADGKCMFLSIDSREAAHNPLFKALKAKSFTDGDISLHFALFDILADPDCSLSLSEIVETLDRDIFSRFDEPMTFDESTVRKKLDEYAREGIILKEKDGRRTLYRRAPDISFDNADALDFFSEVAPCGVLGSFLLDKLPPHPSAFRFKHHYITHVIDSDILCQLLCAIRDKSAVTVETLFRSSGDVHRLSLVPLHLLVSAQTGRQYLAAYDLRYHHFVSCRIDYILTVENGETCEAFDELLAAFRDKQRHMWGVNARKKERLEHVEFTVHIGDGEEHIYRRLLRERRVGTVERLDRHTARFSADVYDTTEMIPWMRTFICRIKRLSFSNRTVENQFKADIQAMCHMYGIESEVTVP